MNLHTGLKVAYCHDETGQLSSGSMSVYPEMSECHNPVNHENNENRAGTWQPLVIPPQQNIAPNQHVLEMTPPLPYRQYDELSPQLTHTIPPTRTYPPSQEHFSFYAPVIDTDTSSSSVASSSLSSASISPDSTPNNYPQASRKLIHTCKVCGDKASGYHYGVTSCEGCKGFFRRSCYRSNDYKCLRDKDCDINKQNRNRCQFCRFKRCVEVGMARDVVRSTKAQPKRFKSTDTPLDADEVVVSSSTSPEPKSSEYLKLVQSLAASHHLHCGHTDMKVRGMVPKLLDMNFDGLTMDEMRLHAWKVYTAEIVKEFESFVEFAKAIPSFLFFPSNDQVFLLKNCFFEIYLVRICRGLSQKGLLLANGKFIELKTLKIIFGRLADEMIEFSQKFLGLGITDDEIALFIAVLLTTPDPHHTFEAQSYVQDVHDVIVLALQRRLSENPGGEAILQKLGDMRQDLKHLNHHHNHEIQFLRERPRLAQTILPPLFMEVYQFERHEEVIVPEQNIPFEETVGTGVDHGFLQTNSLYSNAVPQHQIEPHYST